MASGSRPADRTDHTFRHLNAEKARNNSSRAQLEGIAARLDAQRQRLAAQAKTNAAVAANPLTRRVRRFATATTSAALGVVALFVPRAKPIALGLFGLAGQQLHADRRDARTRSRLSRQAAPAVNSAARADSARIEADVAAQQAAADYNAAEARALTAADNAAERTPPSDGLAHATPQRSI